MDLSFFTTPTGIAVIAAGSSFIAGLLGTSITTLTTRRTHKERLRADEQLAERRFKFDQDLAEKRFALDSALADRKRRQDLAEEVLSGFYQVRDIMQTVRSPISYSSEAEGRQKPEHEPEDVGRQRDAYYAILARLDARREPIANLMARRYRMAAWFGPKAEEPFQTLHEAIAKVSSSASNLVRWSGPDAERIDRDLWQRMEGNIWWEASDPDPIDAKVKEAIAAAEAICRPALEGRIR